MPQRNEQRQYEEVFESELLGSCCIWLVELKLKIIKVSNKCLRMSYTDDLYRIFKNHYSRLPHSFILVVPAYDKQ